MKNPFKEGSTSCRDFNALSDMKWHCTKCELKSGQAKTWQIWRQMGIQLDKDERGNWYKKIYCKKCDGNTIHRKLRTLDISEDTKTRSGLSPKLADRIKKVLKYEEAMLLRKMMPKELEVDHKFPQVRWGSDEEVNDINMSEEQIKDKFILLSRSNNLLKSRYCEDCYRTGQRGIIPGIEYWYQGTKNWDKKIDKHDKKGCVGCFWNDPYKWRKELKKALD